MKSVDLNTKLRSIATALERIIRSDYPAAARYNQLVADRHKEKVTRASDYYDELMQFNRVLPYDAHVVAKNTFERILRESDYAEVEEGEYIRVATAWKDPREGCQVFVWLMPINAL